MCSWRRIKKDFHQTTPGPVLVTKLAPTYYRKLDLTTNITVCYRELGKIQMRVEECHNHNTSKSTWYKPFSL
jgi:hypothetical protein